MGYLLPCRVCCRLPGKPEQYGVCGDHTVGPMQYCAARILQGQSTCAASILQGVNSCTDVCVSILWNQSIKEQGMQVTLGHAKSTHRVLIRVFGRSFGLESVGTVSLEPQFGMRVYTHIWCMYTCTNVTW